MHVLTVAVVAGIIVMVAPAVPMVGQPGPASPDSGLAVPPPLPPGTPPPADPGGPDLEYQLKGECFGAAPGSNVVVRNKPWGQTRLRVDELHRFATGKGQRVAVVDTGVNPHDFLDGRLSGGGDYVVARDNGLRDCDGHGTEVAGIIAAKPPPASGIGFTGVAPDATIVSIRQTSGRYEGTPAPTPDEPYPRTRQAGSVRTLAQAIVHAADRVEHGVINISVNRCRPASDGPIDEAEREVQAALRYAVDERDVVVVASAGNLGKRGCPDQNNGPDPGRPTVIVIPSWFSEYVLSVAAIERDGDPAAFSVHGPWVSVAAPGTEITSLNPANDKTLANRVFDEAGKPAAIEGTSFAAPYVAGTAALVRERFNELTARQVMHRIRTTASHPAAIGGRDDVVGHGMINPIAALTAIVPSEQNVPADRPITITAEHALPPQRDRTPELVALIGSLGGLGVLLLTMFVVHTVRRGKRAP